MAGKRIQERKLELARQHEAALQKVRLTVTVTLPTFKKTHTHQYMHYTVLPPAHLTVTTHKQHPARSPHTHALLLWCSDVPVCLAKHNSGLRSFTILVARARSFALFAFITDERHIIFYFWGVVPSNVVYVYVNN